MDLSCQVSFPRVLKCKAYGEKMVCNKINSAPVVNDMNTTTKMISPKLLKTTTPLIETRVVGNGRYGRFGGKYVPEGLISCLNQFEVDLKLALRDPLFQAELATTLKDYVGRETPLYFSERLTSHYKNDSGEGPEIYLKREDLNHTGSHKINNATAQAMLAKRMGKKRVVAATAGPHGVATAAACAKLSLECTILMGSDDIKKQSAFVPIMEMFGAQVKSVDGSFKDASSEAVREWAGDVESASYYLSGTVVGPHPFPSIVREFQSIIGKEIRRQASEKWGKKPDVLIACVGSGSNAMGMFDEFLEDEQVRLIGVEGGGFGLESGIHSATLARGEVGVYHGAMSYLLQDEDGQILGPHSIAAGLEFPGVGPELSFLKETKRAEFYTATDQEAVDAFKLLCRLEGIVPSLESSHALAYLEKLCPTLPNGAKVVVNCSGRGDKDIATILKHMTSDFI